jgi:hypothetical protein
VRARILVIGLLSVLLEGYFFSAVGGDGPVLRLSLIILLYVAYLSSFSVLPLFTAAMMGLLLDIIYAYPLGWHIASYIIWLALIMLVIRQGIQIASNRWLAAFFVSLSVVIYNLVFTGSDIWLAGFGTFSRKLFINIGAEVLLVGIITLIFHGLFNKMVTRHSQGK